MFSLNSIGCVTKCGPAGILEGNTTDRYKVNVLKFIQKDFEAIFESLDEEQAAWSDKMNKEHLLDDPSVDLIRVKNMLNSTISMSYPDVVIVACIEHKVFQSIQSN